VSNRHGSYLQVNYCCDYNYRLDVDVSLRVGTHVCICMPECMCVRAYECKILNLIVSAGVSKISCYNNWIKHFKIGVH
jgi:hypothetical protein